MESLRVGWFRTAELLIGQSKAIQVEDHRWEYALFEGVIPEECRAGIDMLRDCGIWEPFPSCTDVDASPRNGLLKFPLHGVRLKGTWELTRVKCPSGNRRKPAWMLRKEQTRLSEVKPRRASWKKRPQASVLERHWKKLPKVGTEAGATMSCRESFSMIRCKPQIAGECLVKCEVC